MVKLHASFVFKLDELEIFLSRFQSLKLPTNYGGPVAKHVLDNKLGSMKSHDYHMLIQQLLHLCLQGFMAIDT
jgi:hypothetical protein